MPTNNSGYATLKETWVKQGKCSFNPVKPENTKEKYGAFSISAAVRGSYSNNWANPWERQPSCCGIN